MINTDERDRERFLKIAEYIDIGTPASCCDLGRADGAIVFCRQDPGMARATAELFRRQRIFWAMLTGGFGKDSGDLKIPEAEHQRALLMEQYHVSRSQLLIESTATNGAENSRFSMRLILNSHLPYNSLILVMHPRSARRLYAVHRKIAREELDFTSQYQVVTMDDPFDPTNPSHQQEVLRELIRVADWPAKGLSDPQPDLPVDLVAWAREKLRGNAQTLGQSVPTPPESPTG